MTLKEIILDYRTANNLSQREFAAKCGLSNAAISNIEKDKVNPNTGKKTVTSIGTCVKIADGMGISLDDLVEMLDNVPIRINLPGNRTKLRPVMPGETDPVYTPENKQPMTEEARIISGGIDRMPKEMRQRALNIMQLAFTEYADYFTEEGNEEKQ